MPITGTGPTNSDMEMVFDNAFETLSSNQSASTNGDHWTTGPHTTIDHTNNRAETSGASFQDVILSQSNSNNTSVNMHTFQAGKVYKVQIVVETYTSGTINLVPKSIGGVYDGCFLSVDDFGEGEPQDGSSTNYSGDYEFTLSGGAGTYVVYMRARYIDDSYLELQAGWNGFSGTIGSISVTGGVDGKINFSIDNNAGVTGYNDLSFKLVRSSGSAELVNGYDRGVTWGTTNPPVEIEIGPRSKIDGVWTSSNARKLSVFNQVGMIELIPGAYKLYKTVGGVDTDELNNSGTIVTYEDIVIDPYQGAAPPVIVGGNGGGGGSAPVGSSIKFNPYDPANTNDDDGAAIYIDPNTGKGQGNHMYGWASNSNGSRSYNGSDGSFWVAIWIYIESATNNWGDTMGDSKYKTIASHGYINGWSNPYASRQGRVWHAGLTEYGGKKGLAFTVRTQDWLSHPQSTMRYGKGDTFTRFTQYVNLWGDNADSTYGIKLNQWNQLVFQHDGTDISSDMIDRIKNAGGYNQLGGGPFNFDDNASYHFNSAGYPPAANTTLGTNLRVTDGVNGGHIYVNGLKVGGDGVNQGGLYGSSLCHTPFNDDLQTNATKLSQAKLATNRLFPGPFGGTYNSDKYSIMVGCNGSPANNENAAVGAATTPNGGTVNTFTFSPKHDAGAGHHVYFDNFMMGGALLTDTEISNMYNYNSFLANGSFADDSIYNDVRLNLWFKFDENAGSELIPHHIAHGSGGSSDKGSFTNNFSDWDDNTTHS